MAMLWDLNEGKHLYTLSTTETINALAVAPAHTSFVQKQVQKDTGIGIYEY